jgi:hypothetical protein
MSSFLGDRLFRLGVGEGLRLAADSSTSPSLVLLSGRMGTGSLAVGVVKLFSSYSISARVRGMVDGYWGLPSSTRL